MSRRLFVAQRLSAETLQWVDAEALRRGLVKSDGVPNRSEMIRLMLDYAMAHKPATDEPVPETAPSARPPGWL